MTDTGETKREGRERLHQDRRNDVLRVAARLFAQNGFRGTSMDDIARELGILKGSLYYWIDSKEALLAEVLTGALEQTIEQAREIVARPLTASGKLRLLIHLQVDEWLRNPDNFNVFMSEYRWLAPGELERYYAEKEVIEQIYKQVVREGIAQGEFTVAPQDVTIVVNSIFGVVNWFPRWYRAGQWASPEYIAEVFVGVVLKGVASVGER